MSAHAAHSGLTIDGLHTMNLVLYSLVVLIWGTTWIALK